ncbi:hypothetical protein BDF14DRAFT_1881242 [Spinellus fusiger]|nr:hypothetical protein BDF14DRAFT_1881242 [Spinellus fusiger]
MAKKTSDWETIPIKQSNQKTQPTTSHTSNEQKQDNKKAGRKSTGQTKAQHQAQHEDDTAQVPFLKTVQESRPVIEQVVSSLGVSPPIPPSELAAAGKSKKKNSKPLKIHALVSQAKKRHTATATGNKKKAENSSGLAKWRRILLLWPVIIVSIFTLAFYCPTQEGELCAPIAPVIEGAYHFAKTNPYFSEISACLQDSKAYYTAAAQPHVAYYLKNIKEQWVHLETVIVSDYLVPYTSALHQQYDAHLSPAVETYKTLAKQHWDIHASPCIEQIKIAYNQHLAPLVDNSVATIKSHSIYSEYIHHVTQHMYTTLFASIYSCIPSALLPEQPSVKDTKALELSEPVESIDPLREAKEQALIDDVINNVMAGLDDAAIQRMVREIMAELTAEDTKAFAQAALEEVTSILAETESVETQLAAETESVETQLAAETESVETQLAAETESVETQLAAETESVETQLAAETESVETQLAAETESVETESVETQLAAETESVETQLAAETESVETQLAAETESVETQLAAETESVETESVETQLAAETESVETESVETQLAAETESVETQLAATEEEHLLA